MTDEPCTREDLQAAVALYWMFDTKADGELGDYWQQWDEPRDAQESEIAAYRCQSCGEYFELEKRGSEESRSKAWQAALDHLKVEEVRHE